MTVRKLKAKQRGGRECDWCGVQATHRGFMFEKQSCHEHLEELAAWDRRAQAPDYSDAAFYGGF